MSFCETRKKAFDFCADATKQLITLSTAIIAFTVTFGKDFLGAVPDESRILAYLAWGAHVLSIIFGLLVLLALTAQLEPKKTQSAAYVPSIRGAPATYSGLQILSFLIAIGLTAYFGYTVAGSQSQPSPSNLTMQSLQFKVEALERHGMKFDGELAGEAEERVEADAETQVQVQRLSQQLSALRRKSSCESSCER